MIKITIPKENANDDIVIVGEFLVTDGSKVSKGQSIAELETSKVNFTLNAPEGGFIQYKCEEGAIMEVGATLAVILDVLPKTKSNECGVSKSKTIKSTIGERIFSIKALRLIDELGVSADCLTNTGFVTSEDIRGFAMSE